MKDKNAKKNPYRTNRGGLITSPYGKPEGEPSATKTQGKGDLRSKKTNK